MAADSRNDISADEQLATSMASRSQSIELEESAEAPMIYGDDSGSNPWTDANVYSDNSRQPASKRTSNSATSMFSMTKRVGSIFSRSTESTPVPSSPEVVNGSAQLSQSGNSTPFSPSRRGRYSVESTSTTKGLTDWTVQGSGQRVGYEDLSAIDWIHEYQKERQHEQVYQRQQGIWGKLKLLADSSEIWVILIATGIVVGVIAAGIDIVSNWLGDIKLGYCKSSFYLSQAFCCWGVDEKDVCDDWVSWGEALHAKGGGSYVVSYLFYIVFGVLFGSSASLLVLHYAPYAGQSGIPEIKTVLGGFIIRGFMGFWTLLTKTLGLCLASASGLWLGKEGPLVHVACCCANLATRVSARLRHNEARKREIFSAAAAAGITVAFGAPIGGVLFSLEQVSYYFPDKTMWQSFVCAMVASVSIQLLNPFRTGKLVLFQVISSRPFHKFELVPFILLGIIGGIFGGLFIKLNMRIARWRTGNRILGYPLVEVILLSFATAIINFPDPFSRLQNNILVFRLFQECNGNITSLCNPENYATTMVLLLLVCVLGFFFTAYTFGTSIPSGVLMPSMAIGACYGRMVGIAMEVWQKRHPDFFLFDVCLPDLPCITPGVYAIVGAASALGGATRLTVSLVVIMFELTGALTYVLPIMVAVMVSKWVGDAFEKKGIYESWIHFHDYPYLDNKEETIADITVAEIMTRLEELVVLTATGHTVDSLEHILATQNCKGFPVVADSREAILLGYISRSELRYALQQAQASGLGRDARCYLGGSLPAGEEGANCVDLRQWVDQTPITLQHRSSLQLAVSMFQKLGLRYMLLTMRGQLQGLITKKDICAKYTVQ
ncbi:chloride channel [Lipomyces tetrasporus]|uniref:Chloride channel protein n=1 Tax=Lipomyces tetrasporus TaxID=54092 RepID=A0AAD7VTD7_9ASCO|nr:chloride channel [Lipomyces tetrasporus]KAJ8101992.1 chloride channel [Lipomyces tetrasporus]